MFQFQQLYLFVDSAGVPGQTAVGTNDPVAGNDNGDFIVPDSSANRLRRHPFKSLLCGKLPGLDCVSIGPDIADIHTPREHMSIASVQRVWALLLEVLKRSKA